MAKFRKGQDVVMVSNPTHYGHVAGFDRDGSVMVQWSGTRVVTGVDPENLRAVPPGYAGRRLERGDATMRWGKHADRHGRRTGGEGSTAYHDWESELHRLASQRGLSYMSRDAVHMFQEGFSPPSALKQMARTNVLYADYETRAVERAEVAEAISKAKVSAAKEKQKIKEIMAVAHAQRGGHADMMQNFSIFRGKNRVGMARGTSSADALARYMLKAKGSSRGGKLRAQRVR